MKQLERTFFDVDKICACVPDDQHLLQNNKNQRKIQKKLQDLPSFTGDFNWARVSVASWSFAELLA